MQFVAMQFVVMQFVMLGAISVGLNTAVDAVVVLAAPRVIRRVQQGSGAILVALGLSLLLARRPA